MRKALIYYIIAAIIVVALGVAGYLIFFHESGIRIKNILATYEKAEKYSELTITYPLDGTLFPPEIVSPIFRWKDNHSKTDTWLVTLRFHDDEGPLSFLTNAPEWRPSDEQWEMIKRRSLEKEARVTVIGINHTLPEKILSAASITISTSKDEVGDSIFYREVILPFSDAVVDPSVITWRFGAVSSKTQPAIVLEDLPVCGNCHSFSADGGVLGMDVDYANDKGSYAITPVEEEITLDKSKIITWADYKREDGELTFGLLSQISPDGNYVVSTVKDRSVFVATEGLFFSQLFFPIKGILAVYTRGTKTFQDLPGANNPEFVQSNPTWSPDGKYIVFARSKMYQLKYIKKKDTKIILRQEREKPSILLSKEEAHEFLEEGKTFLYDLYRIPFNDGKGGKPEPLEGASHNGMSNYFARYSPDGKWIVFCKARSFMLLQPDSELYIIPSKGGKARRMRCNTPRMNSWHSWSSNSRWLVFSSKVNTAYTQLFITHIDEQGNSTPPVLLEHFTSPDRAANIPEFVKRKPEAIKVIREQFLDDTYFVRAASELSIGGDYNGEVQALRKALEFNPKNMTVHGNLGLALLKLGKLEEAIVHYKEVLRLNQEARRLDPENVEAYNKLAEEAHNNLGTIMFKQGKLEEAAEHFRKALRLNPDSGTTHNNLGMILSKQGKFQEAIVHYKKARRLDPENEVTHYNLGSIMFKQGKVEEAAEHFRKALRLKPNLAAAHKNLAVVLEKLGRFEEAALSYTEAIRLDPKVKEPLQ